MSGVSRWAAPWSAALHTQAGPHPPSGFIRHTRLQAQARPPSRPRPRPAAGELLLPASLGGMVAEEESGRAGHVSRRGAPGVVAVGVTLRTREAKEGRGAVSWAEVRTAASGQQSPRAVVPGWLRGRLLCRQAVGRATRIRPQWLRPFLSAREPNLGGTLRTWSPRSPRSPGPTAPPARGQALAVPRRHAPPRTGCLDAALSTSTWPVRGAGPPGPPSPSRGSQPTAPSPLACRPPSHLAAASCLPLLRPEL